MVSPAEFIPVAEETGLISELGEWVLTHGLRRGRDLARRHPASRSTCRRCSSEPDAGAKVVAALAASALRRDRLELEITEAVLIRDDEAALTILHQLRELGVRIALDDFGTGYSSLSYLQRFPFDKIKIDRCFISDIAEPEIPRRSCRRWCTLAAARHMATTAEGVETEAQREVLRELGCSPDAGLAVQPGRAGGETEAAVVGAGGGGLARPVTRPSIDDVGMPSTIGYRRHGRPPAGRVNERVYVASNSAGAPRLATSSSPVRNPVAQAVFLAARRRGDHLGFFLLRLFRFAITALLTLCHVALHWWFELVELIRLQQPSARGADPDVHVAFAQQFCARRSANVALPRPRLELPYSFVPLTQIRHNCCPSH